MKRFKLKEILSWADQVLATEVCGIDKLRKSLDEEFFKSVNILYSCRGRIIVTGMGKAGIIGQKFSATLSSTGSSSFWLHAAEAVHGDLGRIKEGDVVVVLSYSGETDEIKHLIPFVKKIGAKIIAITGNISSNLARYADGIVSVKVDKEACPLGLAPTTSTTVMLVVCDALSVVLQKMKGFKQRDFAFFHPRGSLGRKLLLSVKDAMRTNKYNPVVSENTLIKDVLLKITTLHAGAASVVDKKGCLVGIFTDGDLRRNLERFPHLLRKKVSEVMTKGPTVVRDTDLASQALRILEKRKIDEVPVVDKNYRPVGMLDIQDLIAAGII
ncbi:MAG: KpsF/GutQ family sugar-phosphate isomerase [Candidatus Omnitrophica bacterium]|nr:KpsF/GutQ family sugar-phosphate isomerase [Candidatus Omnitrophota bacterium]MBU2250817.1 KpsF/GutQ family sugar-phosphate isomerase [Candidatus Omnitrophota bacterium]MBU2474157.1 KpsF/GutQ family sugar-phosphate isomerase [Candidatus Omnitrophota bacterium]